MPLVNDVESDLKVLQKYQSDVNLVCYEKVVETLSIKQFYNKILKQLQL